MNYFNTLLRSRQPATGDPKLDTQTTLKKTLRGIFFQKNTLDQLIRTPFFAAIVSQNLDTENTASRANQFNRGMEETLKNNILFFRKSVNPIFVFFRCVGLICFFTACQTTTARFVDSRSGEIALVSIDRKESLHASTLKSGATETVMANIKKSTNASATSERVKKYVQLSKLQLIRGDLDAADKSIKKCLEIDLKNKDAKLVLAQIYFRKGFLDLSEMILNSTEFSGTSASEMQNIRALIAYENKNASAAWAILEEAVRLDPSNIAARLNFGMLLLEHQLTQKAAIQFERILQLVPKQPDALLMMSMIEARRGNENIAVTNLNELKGEFKDNPTLVFNYGSVLFHSGKYEEASNYLKSYLKLASKKQTGTAATSAENERSQDAMAMIEDIRERLEEEEIAKEQSKNIMASTSQTTPLNNASNESNDSNTVDNMATQIESEHTAKKSKNQKSNDIASKKRITDESPTKDKEQSKNKIANRDRASATYEGANQAAKVSGTLKQNGEMEDLDQLLQN